MMPITCTDRVHQSEGVARLLLWTGPKHSGKTTLLQHLVQTMLAERYTVAGFVAPSRYEGGKLVGFDVVDVNTNQRIPLALRRNDHRDRSRFSLLPEGLKLGRDCLRRAATASVDLVVADEYGPLELAHKGWRLGVDRLMATTNAEVLLVVREELVDQVRQEYDETTCVKLLAHESRSFGKVMTLLQERRIGPRERLATITETSLPASRRGTDEMEMYGQQKAREQEV